MSTALRVIPWLGLVVGLVVAAWGGGTLRWAAVHRDNARYRHGWTYFVVGWVMLSS